MIYYFYNPLDILYFLSRVKNSEFNTIFTIFECIYEIQRSSQY